MTTRDPCPVCGHPTGDCVGEQTGTIRLLGANIFPSLGYEDRFVVLEDVFEDRPVVKGQDWNPDGIKSARRLFKQGQSIPWSVAVAHGLVPA